MDTKASKPAKKGIKSAMQTFGTKLSGMVLPNIGAFIAWGLITAIFLKDGWLPNADLAKLIDPMKIIYCHFSLLTQVVQRLLATVVGSWGYCHDGGHRWDQRANVYRCHGDGTFRWLVY